VTVRESVVNLVKTATPATVSKVGDVITYSFEVENNGNVPLMQGVITDPMLTNAGVSIQCPVWGLNPGQSTVCTAQYTVTAADLTNGSVTNTATATGTDPDGNQVTSPQTSVTTPVSAISIQKTADRTAYLSTSDVVGYSFLVTNTGMTTLSGVAVDDPMLSAASAPVVVSCPGATLAAGASMTCTASYSPTAADMAAGSIVNTATASGTDASGKAVTSAPSTATVWESAVNVMKTATPATVSQVGDVISYSFEVDNIGQVPLTDVTVGDPTLSAMGVSIQCPASSLGVGGTTTCTAQYTVTSADLTNGEVINTATATGVDPDGDQVPSPPSTVTTPVSGISIQKISDRTAYVDSTNTIIYSFVVTNTGTSILSGVSVSDPMLSGASTPIAVDCPSTLLLAGASMTCYATYAPTAADISAGSIVNTATASGADTSGKTVTSTPSTVTAWESALNLVKTATPDSVTAAGDVITYSFALENDSQGPITAIQINDPMLEAAGATITCVLPALNPGQATTCTAQYTVTTADIANDEITNTATATGQDVNFDSVTSPPTTVVTPVSAITIQKTADRSAFVDSTDTITYSFLVSNTGDTSLSGVAVDDPMLSGASTPIPVSCPTTLLEAGASMTCTASYSPSASDVTAGSVVNTATATGTDSAGKQVTSTPSTVTVWKSSFSLVKTAAPATVNKVGDVITYTFTVTNNGKATLSGGAISDPMLDAAGVSIHCPAWALDSGQSVTCTAQYPVTAADIANGVVTNTATGTSTDSNGDTVTAPPTTVSTPVSAISIQKTADRTAFVDSSDVIGYSFLVANTGTASLTGVGVTDPMLSAATPPIPVSCPSTVLAAGASMTCEADYSPTAMDIHAGSVVNTATSYGTDPSGKQIASAPSTVTVWESTINLVKTATPATVSKAGDTITYTFAVSNNGKVPLTNGVINDAMLAAAGDSIVCQVWSLNPGQSTTCTAQYTVTSADVAAGVVSNTATATGTDPNGDQVTSPPTTATTPVSGITILKTADRTAVTRAGDAITYSFLVTNTGTSSLSGILVDDPKLASAGVSIDCPRTTLGAGASMTCTATDVISQVDSSLGVIVNQATVSGTDSSGLQVTSPPSKVTVGESLISVVKTADKTSVVAAGDKVVYSFLVTDEGTTPLSDVAVVDPMLTAAQVPVSCPKTALAAGESMTCTAQYTATASDISSGLIMNTASATGVDGINEQVTSDNSTAMVGVSGISIEKTADRTAVASAGETVVYSFQVSNTGTVPLTDVAVSDPSLTAAGVQVSCPDTELAAGAGMTCTASYTVTAADIAAGQVVNTATASGTDPTGTQVTSPPSTVPVEVSTLQIVKTASPAAVHAVGDLVTYSFAVTNNGEDPLTNVSVNDSMLAAAGAQVSCPKTTLAVGESMTCSATYTVTSADLTAGQVANTATATGTDAQGDTVTSPPSRATVLTEGISVVKTADRTTVDAAGDQIAYSFLVTNTGTMALTGVTVDDPMLGAAKVSVSCPQDALAGGTSMICTATYPATQPDIDAGSVLNTATAWGLDSSGNEVISSQSDVTVTAPQVPSISLTQSTTPDMAKVGETIQYSFAITNTGNVTLTDIQLSQVSFTGTGNLAGMSSLMCSSQSDVLGSQTTSLSTVILAPGQTVYCVLPLYTVTAADAALGQVYLSAIATGVPVGGRTTVTSVTSQETHGQTLIPLVAPPAVHTGGSVASSGPVGVGGLVALLLVVAGGLVFLLVRKTRTR